MVNEISFSSKLMDLTKLDNVSFLISVSIGCFCILGSYIKGVNKENENLLTKIETGMIHFKDKVTKVVCIPFVWKPGFCI